LLTVEDFCGTYTDDGAWRHRVPDYDARHDRAVGDAKAFELLGRRRMFVARLAIWESGSAVAGLVGLVMPAIMASLDAQHPDHLVLNKRPVLPRCEPAPVRGHHVFSSQFHSDSQIRLIPLARCRR
jgi:hypothetical protein